MEVWEKINGKNKKQKSEDFVNLLKENFLYQIM